MLNSMRVPVGRTSPGSGISGADVGPVGGNLIRCPELGRMPSLVCSLDAASWLPRWPTSRCPALLRPIHPLHSLDSWITDITDFLIFASQLCRRQGTPNNTVRYERGEDPCLPWGQDSCRGRTALTTSRRCLRRLDPCSVTDLTSACPGPRSATLARAQTFA